MCYIFYDQNLTVNVLNFCLITKQPMLYDVNFKTGMLGIGKNSKFTVNSQKKCGSLKKYI